MSLLQLTCCYKIFSQANYEYRVVFLQFENIKHTYRVGIIVYLFTSEYGNTTVFLERQFLRFYVEAGWFKVHTVTKQNHQDYCLMVDFNKWFLWHLGPYVEQGNLFLPHTAIKSCRNTSPYYTVVSWVD